MKNLLQSMLSGDVAIRSVSDDGSSTFRNWQWQHGTTIVFSVGIWALQYSEIDEALVIELVSLFRDTFDRFPDIIFVLLTIPALGSNTPHAIERVNLLFIKHMQTEYRDHVLEYRVLPSKF